MVIETDGCSDECQIEDDEIYDQVLEWLNTDEIHNRFVGNLRSEAEGILEKVENDYLEAEGVMETGPNYPKAKHFTHESDKKDNSGSYGGVGRALTALAEMPDKLTEFDYREESGTNGKTYDMTSVDYNRLCEVLEAATEIKDKELDQKNFREN